jgi:uncharacterized protein YodC (DUF2158 family)
MIEFEIGDIVSLKSGGVAMTVEAVEDERATCIWMSRDGRVRRENLPVMTLRHGDSQFDGIGDLVLPAWFEPTESPN